jgi:hypothetical protein
MFQVVIKTKDLILLAFINHEIFKIESFFGFTTAYAISAYHHLSCEFESRSWQGVLGATFCDQVC